MYTQNAAGESARGCEDLEVYNSERQTKPAELDFPAVVKLTGVSDCSFLAARARLSSMDASRNDVKMEYYPYKFQKKTRLFFRFKSPRIFGAVRNVFVNEIIE